MRTAVIVFLILFNIALAVLLVRHFSVYKLLAFVLSVISFFRYMIYASRTRSDFRQ